MRKTLLSFLLLALPALLFAQAIGDKYTVDFNGGKDNYSDNATEEGPFTFEGNHNFNNKFKDATYNGTDFNNGLKMEKSTVIKFINAGKATVTIVQSGWSANTIKFDGEELPLPEKLENSGTLGVYVYTIENVAIGTHTITRGSGETGIHLVSFVLTGKPKTILKLPEISADKATGEITISSVEYAEKILYTLASDKDEEGNLVEHEYTASFTITEDETITALAFASETNEDYVSSPKSSLFVALTNATIDAPKAYQQNGSVAFKSSQAETTIEYSLDEGTTWNVYKSPITYFENGQKLQARAYRIESKKSGITEITVNSAVAKVEGESSDTIYFNTKLANFDYLAVADESTLGYISLLDGYRLECQTAKKAYLAADSLIIGAGDTISYSIKLSNGANNILTMPTSKKAVRVTIYSYTNGTGTTYWQNVNGVAYGDSIPMNNFIDSEGKTHVNTPDVRVFDLRGENGEGVASFNFMNKGTQPCVVLVVHYLSAKGLDITTTVENAEATDFSVATDAYAGDLVKITKNNGDIAWSKVTVTVTDADGTEVSYNKNSHSFTMPEKAVTVKISVEKEETSALKTVDADNNSNAPVYNLQGQKVGAAYKGIVIKGGKKFIQK